MGLKPLPESFAASRRALHRVAEQLVAPARKPHNEIALTVTPGGFGTPAFEFDDATLQVRVEGTELVLERDGEQSRAQLTSIADGAALLGPELLVDGMPDDREPLEIDPEAAQRLAEFFAFAVEVLERTGAGLPPEAMASPITLWPEHFDVAYEAGSQAGGERATYGASPGDDGHRDPYVYVALWAARTGAPWNATGFPGAELSYADLLVAADPVAAAAEFIDSRARALTG